jgi:hypothetical protein
MSIKRNFDQSLKYAKQHLKRYESMTDEEYYDVPKTVTLTLSREGVIERIRSFQRNRKELFSMYDILREKVGKGYIRKLDKYINERTDSLTYCLDLEFERNKELLLTLSEIDRDGLRLFLMMQ